MTVAAAKSGTLPSAAAVPFAEPASRQDVTKPVTALGQVVEIELEAVRRQGFLGDDAAGIGRVRQGYYRTWFRRHAVKQKLSVDVAGRCGGRLPQVDVDAHLLARTDADGRCLLPVRNAVIPGGEQARGRIPVFRIGDKLVVAGRKVKLKVWPVVKHAGTARTRSGPADRSENRYDRMLPSGAENVAEQGAQRNQHRVDTAGTRGY